MDLETVRELLADQHHAVLATRRRDGTAQLSPVTVALDEAGRPVISSRQTAYKVRNLRRDPYASICVFPDSFYGGRWVQVDGDVEILDLPEAMEPLVAYYRAAMIRDRRVLIRMSIMRAGPDREG